VILSVLEGAGGGSQGFVETQSVYSRTQELGFLPGQIDAAVMRGLNFRMMETYPRFDDPSEARDAIRLRVTTAGAYTVRSLMRLFAYVDLTVVDTPIVDNGYRDRIRDVHSISDRLQRARVFLSYLDAQYVANPILAESPFDWSTTLAALDASISEVERRTGTPRVDT
jgi:hypothetical protein